MLTGILAGVTWALETVILGIALQMSPLRSDGKIAFLAPFIAALCATLSYMFYYRSISKIGAAKAMALNITYTAWAILFTVILLGDLSVLNPMTLTFAPMIVVCGFFAATDIKQIFQIKKRIRKE